MSLAVARDAVREVLSSHDIGVTDLSCQRCGRGYRQIVETLRTCDVPPSSSIPPTDPDYRPGVLRPSPRRAAGYGYVDPRRRNMAWVRIVCEPKLRAALIEKAEEQHVSLSEVVRRACRRYVGMPE